MIFADHLRFVLDMREQDGVRGISHERNRALTHLFDASFAQKEVHEITSLDLRDWLREMLAKDARDNRDVRKLDPGTVKRAFALVRSAFTVAVERDIIKTNPCSGVQVKKRVDERSTREKWSILSHEEQRAVVACTAIPIADRLAIQFAIHTGLRQGEQFSLRLTDLHTGIHKPHALVRYGGPKDLPPKSGKVRKVPLIRDALTAARQWLYELPTFAPENPLGLVFPTPGGRRRGIGKPLGNGGVFRAHLKHVGITRRVRWHDLRHTFASSLIAGWWGRKWSLEEVQPMCGHSSILITQRYAHMGDDDLAAAAAETCLEPMPIARARADFYAFEWDENTAVAS